MRLRHRRRVYLTEALTFALTTHRFAHDEITVENLIHFVVREPLEIEFI